MIKLTLNKILNNYFQDDCSELYFCFSKIVKHIEQYNLFFEDFDMELATKSLSQNTSQMICECFSLMLDGRTVSCLNFCFDLHIFNSIKSNINANINELIITKFILLDIYQGNLEAYKYLEEIYINTNKKGESNEKN